MRKKALIVTVISVLAVIACAVTLFACKPTEYTVTFELGGGEMQVHSLTVEKGEAVDLSAYTPTRQGYVFTGWTDESGNAVTLTVVNSDVTFTAGWQAAQNTVTYYVNGEEYLVTSALTGETVTLASYDSEDTGEFFGWFTDGRFQKDFVDEHNYYSEKVLYHHKSFYMRIGLPEGRWVWEMGYRLDSQFGGKKTDNATGEVFDNGGGWKRYWHALIPQKGDSETTLGDQVQYEGNILGSEFLKLTHNNDLFSLSAYLENYFDDFSGMGKLNGFDGLWGIEYKGHKFKYIDNAVFEYYQSTHQSGPLHGLDFDDMALKTGGADDYYNNFFYTGWEHWGYSLGTPLSVSPVYNDNGSLRFYYNRVRAFHVAFSGDLSDEVSYVGRFNHSRTWGTPFMPTPEMKKSVSAAIEIDYSPAGLKSWHFRFGVGGDVSDVYGDNIGLSVAVRKCFDIVK